MPWLEFIGIGISALAGLIAIRGDTWRVESRSWYQKLTITGWLALVVIGFGSSISVYTSWKKHWLDRLAVRPILSELRLLHGFTAEYRMLEMISESNEKERAQKARLLIVLPEMKQQYQRYCHDYIQEWERWAGETDPRVRADLKMIVFMCQRDALAPDDFSYRALEVARYSVCQVYSQSRICEPQNKKEVREKLNETFLAPSNSN